MAAQVVHHRHPVVAGLARQPAVEPLLMLPRQRIVERVIYGHPAIPRAVFIRPPELRLALEASVCPSPEAGYIEVIVLLEVTGNVPCHAAVPAIPHRSGQLLGVLAGVLELVGELPQKSGDLPPVFVCETGRLFDVVPHIEQIERPPRVADFLHLAHYLGQDWHNPLEHLNLVRIAGQIVAYCRGVERGGRRPEVLPLCPVDPRLDCFGFALVGGSAARQHHLHRMRIRYVTLLGQSPDEVIGRLIH